MPEASNFNPIMLSSALSRLLPILNFLSEHKFENQFSRLAKTKTRHQNTAECKKKTVKIQLSSVFMNACEPQKTVLAENCL